jgi:hypothetical protein
MSAPTTIGLSFIVSPRLLIIAFLFPKSLGKRFDHPVPKRQMKLTLVNFQKHQNAMLHFSKMLVLCQAHVSLF